MPQLARFAAITDVESLDRYFEEAGLAVSAVLDKMEDLQRAREGLDSGPVGYFPTLSTIEEVSEGTSSTFSSLSVVSRCRK